MEKVLGIGGLFFRAKDPKALAAWYEKYLGITPVPTDYDQPAWTQQAGTTVFSPFAGSTDYFGDKSLQWMVNFRVRNLDAMVAQLVAAGSKVVVDEHEYPNGRFARTHDPEGHPIELWEPKEPA